MMMRNFEQAVNHLIESARIIGYSAKFVKSDQKWLIKKVMFC